MRQVKLYRSKGEIFVLVFGIAVLFYSFSPLSEEFGERAYVFYEAISQGTEIDFHNHKINLGYAYLYYENKYTEGLDIKKVAPGFSGLEQGFRLSAETESQNRIDEVKNSCLSEKSTCAYSESAFYNGVSLATVNPYSGEYITQNYYFNPECNVFLRHFGKKFDKRYAEFVGTFFESNCPQIETNS